MLPVKKILCPTDFSEPSYEALKVANELALNFSAELLLIHVINPIPIVSTPTGPMSFNVSSYQKELEDSAKNSLQDIINQMVAKELKVIPIVAYGIAADEIVSIAEEQNVDMIVIATHGRTGFRHLISGSVTEKVVRISNHPVLTIRAKRVTN